MCYIRKLQGEVDPKNNRGNKDKGMQGVQKMRNTVSGTDVKRIP